MFENFEHKADIGIRGFGKTYEEAFQEGAKAMFSIECNLDKVEKIKKIKIKCDAQNIEELFVEWLNQLLAQASVHEMMFSDFEAEIKEDKKQGKFILIGEAYGEKLNEKHELKTEIKAATYSQLKVFEDKDKNKDKNKRFIAQCIVDV